MHHIFLADRKHRERCSGEIFDLNLTTKLNGKRAERERSKTTNSARLFWGCLLLGLLLFAVLAWALDLKWLHDRAQSLNGAVVFVLMALLPVLGFPASILYVVGGARFGHVWGLVAALGAIVIHLFLSWWIAHSWLKRPLELLTTKLGRRIPKVPDGEHVPVCLLVTLMPGVSYALKNYLLVLAGVPFRQFFWTCLPVHFSTSALGIMFGGFTGSMAWPQVIFLIAYAALLIGLSRYVFQRIKRRDHQTCDANVEADEARDATS